MDVLNRCAHRRVLLYLHSQMDNESLALEFDEVHLEVLNELTERAHIIIKMGGICINHTDHLIITLFGKLDYQQNWVRLIDAPASGLELDQSILESKVR